MGIHLLAYFEPCHRTRKFDMNNDNLIYGHNQDYYRKSYLLEMLNCGTFYYLVLRTIHSFSSFNTTLDTTYLLKRETYNPLGY